MDSSAKKGDSITDRLMGSSTVDKHELTVPINQNSTSYRGGTSAHQM